MQSSKNSKNGSSDVPQKASPMTPPRKLKVPALDSDSVPSPNKANRTPKDKSPKVVKRGSPRCPAAEKKRPSKVSELESQISQLQEELKKVKDQLTSSESTTKQAKEEVEEAKNELAAMSAKLEASQKQLTKLSASEEAMDEKFEATQNQHSSDLNNLRHELTETLSLVEELKCQLRECEKSESRALELLTDTQVKLEMAKTVEENLRAEGLKAEEANMSVALELEKLKSRVEGENEGSDKLKLELIDTQVKLEMAKTVEENLRAEGLKAEAACKSVALELEKLKSRVEGDNEGSDKLKLELIEVKATKEKLKSALDLAEEENIQSTFVIRNVQEQLERTKAELAIREVEMGAELEKAKAEIDELKTIIVAKAENEPELERAKAEIEELKAEIMAYKETKSENGSELERAKAEIEELMAFKETKNENKVEVELKKLENENEKLKAEMESEKDHAISLVEAARASEREALMKVGYLSEEAEKINRKAAYVAEQLEAVQGTNAEMESELRRLKVQSDQWRKAAEAAAAMISPGHNGKLVERTGSLDKGGYNNTIGAKLGSPFSEDFDDELVKKKNGNVLRKFGFFGKKGQK